MDISRNQHQQATSMDTLNRMFTDYNFLKPLNIGIHYVESFWCFHKAETRHFNLLLLHGEVIEDFCIETELQILQKVKTIKHPNLIHIFDVWKIQSKLYVVIDYEDSMTLEEMLNQGRLSLNSVITLSIQLLDCLANIHQYNFAHGRITPDNIHIKNNFLKIAPPTLDQFYQAALHQTEAKQQYFMVDNPEINGIYADLFSAGAVIFFLSTGYSPKTLDPNLWEEYGLDSNLRPLVTQLLTLSDVNAKTALNLKKQLIKINETLFPDKVEKSNLLTKLLRLRATRPIQAPPAEVLHSIEHNHTMGEMDAKKNKSYATGDIIGNRYIVEELVERENFDIVYRARDKDLPDRDVWLHFISFAHGLNWRPRFEVISNQLAKISHPHISQVLDACVVDEGAYLVTQKEDGERLKFFAKRHFFTYEEILEFSKQILDALMAAEPYNFHVYTLSLENIAVYRHGQTGYYYRLTSVGHGHFLSLVHGDENGRKLMLQPETLAPEMHQQNPQGQLTSQFMLGNLIYELIMESHPCSRLSLLQAYNHHLSAAFPKIADKRSDIPNFFQRWIHQLMQINPEDRFDNLQAAFEALQRAPKPEAVKVPIPGSKY